MSRPIAWLLIAAWLLGGPRTANCGEPASQESPSTGDKSVSDKPPLGARVDYLQDVRPILSNTCYACHGPNEASREADLRLDPPRLGFQQPGDAGAGQARGVGLEKLGTGSGCGHQAACLGMEWLVWVMRLPAST